MQKRSSSKGKERIGEKGFREKRGKGSLPELSRLHFLFKTGEKEKENISEQEN